MMISFDGVSRRFGTTAAVVDFSCEFASGKTHVLLGSSGCGKTTLLRMVLGLIDPDTGDVTVDGRKMQVSSRHELNDQMGYVVQEGGLFPHLSVRQNVTLGAEARGWTVERITERVNVLRNLVGFDDDMMDRFPVELSGGQRQRVSLMRALMTDPPILLLDEPLGSLDPMVRDDLQRQLKRIFQALGKTVLFVTHDIREAAFLGETITLMTDGQLVQHGAFSELAQNPASEFVTRFLRAQDMPANWKRYF